MSKRRGAFFPSVADDSEALGKKFLESPSAFSKELGMDPEDLKCPPEAHEAFVRAEAFAAKAKAAGFEPDDKSMAGLKELAAESFGEDFRVSLVPFGLQFREPANLVAADLTATGSGTVTWLDTDADVDG